MATWCDRCKENNDRYLDDIYFYEIEEEEEESRGGYRTHHLCQWCWEKFLFWLSQQPKPAAEGPENK